MIESLQFILPNIEVFRKTTTVLHLINEMYCWKCLCSKGNSKQNLQKYLNIWQENVVNWIHMRNGWMLTLIQRGTFVLILSDVVHLECNYWNLHQHCLTIYLISNKWDVTLYLPKQVEGTAGCIVIGIVFIQMCSFPLNLLN